MLARRNRFRGQIKTDFFKIAQKISTKIAILYYLADDKQKEKRMTVIAGKKYWRQSTQRQKIKRQFRAFLRLQLDLFGPGYYVWVLKPKVGELSSQFLEQEIRQMIRQIKV